MPKTYLFSLYNNTCTEIGMYNVITSVRHHLYKPNLNLTGNLNIVNLHFNAIPYLFEGNISPAIYHTDKTGNHEISSVRKDHSQRSPYLVQLNDNLQDQTSVHYYRPLRPFKQCTNTHSKGGFILLVRQECDGFAMSLVLLRNHYFFLSRRYYRFYFMLPSDFDNIFL
jgi:hypothetical protein